MINKRVILDADDPLGVKTESVLKDIFCRGVVKAKTTNIILGALMGLIVHPVGWISILCSKLIHLIIWGLIIFVAKEEISKFNINYEVVITLVVIVILYKDIYREIQSLLVWLIIFFTGGHVLKWVCEGYVSGAPFRQKVLNNDLAAPLIASLIALTPEPYKGDYDNIADLYLESNDPEAEIKLVQELDDYDARNSSRSNT